MQPIAKMIRGLPLPKAIALLQFTPKKGARIITKVIRSAISNADQKGKIDIDNLYIKLIDVGQGMMHYRVHTRARGSAAWIRKKTSHLTVVLGER